MKTRKNRKKGGATNKLPIPEKYEDFDWGLYFMSSHGNLLEEFFIVPENTYVLHLATAGSPCSKFKSDIEDLIYDDKSGRKTLWKSLKEGTFLKTSKNTIAKEFIYNNSKIEDENTISFYEPGDLIFNIDLNLINYDWPIFLMGLYELPVSHTLRDNLFEINKPYLKNGSNKHILNSSCILTPQQLNFKKYPHIKQTPNINEAHIFNRNDNLLKNEMFIDNITNITLYNLLNNLNAINNNIKLIIIKACRYTKITSKIIMNKQRRYSLSTRSNITPQNMYMPKLNKNIMVYLFISFNIIYSNTNDQEIKEYLFHINNLLNNNLISIDNLNKILEKANSIPYISSLLTKLKV